MKESKDNQQGSTLAQSLDCITDEDLQSLALVKASTTEAWRKRGTGPAYILLGNRYLYPRKAVAQYLESITKERSTVTKAALL